MLEEKEFHTNAGLFSGVIHERIDNNGILRSCMLEKQNKVSFHGQIYIPKYGSEDFRTRYRDAVTFYKSGDLKSLYLEEQQEIDSPVGRIKAELVSFYESGSLHRIFPVYGQLNGYWSESEEAELLPQYVIETGGQRINAKFSCINFYESGAVKSITLWPGESVEVHTSAGISKVRCGISFYENGFIESVEPDQPISIKYNSCRFISYDNHPVGVHGDRNSLGFYEDGTVKTLKTTITAVILSDDNEEIRFAPEKRISPTDIDKMEIVPTKLEFHDNTVTITDSDGYTREYSLDQYTIRTEQVTENLLSLELCGDCSGCSKCGH